ncbi:MAG TPA: hypothetical protein VG759_28685 [Candidatus Angelobacter sp.]|jgi:hypothetical protein|nr:hypothetical protein [Candidatus Angelobacter sp.]
MALLRYSEEKSDKDHSSAIGVLLVSNEILQTAEETKTFFATNTRELTRISTKKRKKKGQVTLDREVVKRTFLDFNSCLLFVLIRVYSWLKV